MGVAFFGKTVGVLPPQGSTPTRLCCSFVPAETLICKGFDRKGGSLAQVRENPGPAICTKREGVLYQQAGKRAVYGDRTHDLPITNRPLYLLS